MTLRRCIGRLSCWALWFLVLLSGTAALGAPAADAATTRACPYDGAYVPIETSVAPAAPTAGLLHAADSVRVRPSIYGYDDTAQPARTSALSSGRFLAPNTTGGGGDCEPECVRAPIIPNEGAVAHIYSKHYPGGAENFPGEATFFGSEDLYDLLDAAELVTPWEDGTNCKRHVDAGRLIGTPIGSPAPTAIYTVITSRPGVLVTAFPGAG